MFVHEKKFLLYLVFAYITYFLNKKDCKEKRDTVMRAYQFIWFITALVERIEAFSSVHLSNKFLIRNTSQKKQRKKYGYE